MKKYLLLVSSVLLLASCSTPKYAYYFDHYDYNSGKKKAESEKSLIAQNQLATPSTSPLQINEEAVAASAESRIATVEKAPVTVSLKDQKSFVAKYSAMSKAEKKEFRKELKSEVKSMIKGKKSGDNINSIANTKVMDNDLKMALIFGIVGIVLGLFGPTNSIFWILSTIALVIGLVFLIMWIAKQ